jgi:hypothetical protein
MGQSERPAYDADWLPWRAGRKVGRTIYAVVRPDCEPSDDDPLIGVMDTPKLAARAVKAHNALLERDREGVI